MVAIQDWDYYAQQFLKEGFAVDKPYPEYPYTFEVAKVSNRVLLLNLPKTLATKSKKQNEQMEITDQQSDTQTSCCYSQIVHF
eukprot:5697265-Amphidinium_carterae.1